MTKILAIDDLQDNLISLRAIITDAFPDSIVFTALNGPAGIDLAISKDPDVILLDIIMPGMDGFEVCRQLKQDPQVHDIPVVFLTAINGGKENRIKALEAGAEAFLSKPIDETELTAQIRAMIKIKVANQMKRDEKVRLLRLVNERTQKLELSRIAALQLLDELKVENEMRKKSEDALRESEERFIQLFERAPLGYQSLDAEGRFIEVNEAWLNVLGYERKEVIGKWFGNFLAPEYMELFRQRFPLFKALGKVHSEFEMIHKNGTYRVLSFEGRIGHNDDGSFQKTHCILQDITERKQVVEALRVSETRLKDAQRLSHTGSFHYDALTDQAWWSDELFRLYGLQPDGKPKSRAEADTYTHPEDQQTGGEMIEQSIEMNDAVENEYRIIRSDGSIRYHHSISRVTTDENNQMISIDATIQDITERKLSEKLLKESNELNATLFQTIPFGMDIVDENGNILFQNENLKRLLGSSSVGKKCWDLYRDDKTQCSNCPLLDGVEIGKTEFYESHGVLGGKTFQISHTGMMFQGRKAMLEIFQDISEKKEAEIELIAAKEKAEESDRLKSAFLANMSHEIRTPLNSIIGFSELLVDPYYDIEQHAEFANLIITNGRNLLSIINDIMDLAKIEAGHIQVKKHLFSVNQLILDTYKDCSFKALEKGIELRLDQTGLETEIFIESDETKLRQVLVNCVGNAIKFTEKGFVGIGIKTEKEFVQFHVKDTGIGIPAEFHKQVFERFRQVETSYTRKYGGNGLGLPISKCLIELLGGTIWMESEKGKGSTFYFKIPFQSANYKISEGRPA